MKLNFKILLSVFYIFFFSNLGTNAQTIEAIEEEEMPVFEDLPIAEEEPLVNTWPRTKDTVRFKRGYKYGFVCNKTEVLIPFDYSELPTKFSNLMVAKKNGLMGVINAKNEIIIPFEYKKITHYADCFSVFKGTNKEGKWGVLDFEGNTILPVKYNGAVPYTGKLRFDGKVPAYIAGKENGNVKLFFNEKAELMKEVPYKKYQYLSDQYIRVTNDEYKQGILNKNDEVVLECSYSKIYWAKENVGCVSATKGMVLINLEDKTVHHNGFNHYSEVDENNNIVVYNYEGKTRIYGLMSLNGEIFIKPSLNFINYVEGTDFYTINKDGRIIDLINTKGESIKGIEEYPSQIGGLQNGFYVARYKSNDNKWKIFKSDRTALTTDLYTNVQVYNPRLKYPSDIIVENLLAEVTLDQQRYYLFKDGAKIKKK